MKEICNRIDLLNKIPGNIVIWYNTFMLVALQMNKRVPEANNYVT